MKPVATVVAIIVLVLLALPLAGPLTGSAQAASGPPPAADDGPLTLRLTQVEPRLVTADGPNTLTVIGVLSNTGRVPVSDLEIRMQRGVALGTEGAVRDALDGQAGTDAVLPQFAPLPGELTPGAQLPVRLSLLLRGPPDSSLALSTAGVHELLINVNGVPQDGARARLAAVRMLLPVLSLPPEPTAPTRVAPDPTPPAASPFTMLYPIADSPRRLPTVPGELPLLTDDELAAAMAPDGRLGGLVTALAAAPVGSPVRNATCLAIDPDLVETAAAMRTGYQVLGADGGPPVPGNGAQVAGQWLDGLIAAARGGCVLALPYADADLVALNRGGLATLASSAITDGRRLLRDGLGTAVLAQTSWPADGVTDEPTMSLMGSADGRAVLLSADAIAQARTPRRAGLVPINGSSRPQFAVLADPLLEVAATGPQQPADAANGGAVPADTPAGGDGPLSTQDLIGTLAFRARSGPDRSGAPVVLAPPHQWAAAAAGATALLQSVETLLDAGLLTPRPLADVVSDGPALDSEAWSVRYPLRASGREVSDRVADATAATGARIEDLRSIAVADSGVGLDPNEVLAPLVRGLLRPMSAAWRGRTEAAVAAAVLTARRIDDLRATVRVLEPPSPYALATSNAPILVTIGNGLPFTVQVRLEISSTSGLRVAPIEIQQVPPLGRRQARVSAEVTRSGQFTVQAAVRSPAGELLGPPSRLRVRSTAYGTITVWLTGSAGVLLVVLAVRRVLRRVRGEPAHRPITDPSPDPSRSDRSPPLERPPAPTRRPAHHGATTGSGPTSSPTSSGPAGGAEHAHPSGDPFPEPEPATELIPVASPPIPAAGSRASSAPHPATTPLPQSPRPRPRPPGPPPAAAPPTTTPPRAGGPANAVPPISTAPTATPPTAGVLANPPPPRPNPPHPPTLDPSRPNPPTLDPSRPNPPALDQARPDPTRPNPPTLDHPAATPSTPTPPRRNPPTAIRPPSR